MYKKSKESVAVTNAKKRLGGMKTVDAEQGAVVEYGDAQKNPCNSTVLESKIDGYDDTQSQLNQTLAKADDLKIQEKALEKEIRSLSSRVLKGAISKFGEDANEIELLGGTRKSDKKRPVRKPKNS